MSDLYYSIFLSSTGLVIELYVSDSNWTFCAWSGVDHLMSQTVFIQQIDQSISITSSSGQLFPVCGSWCWWEEGKKSSVGDNVMGSHGTLMQVGS